MSDVPPPPPPPPPSFGSPPPAGGPTAGNAISYGWKKFQENVGPVLLVILVPIVLQLVVVFPLRLALNGSFILSLFVPNALSMIISAIGSYGIFNLTLQITAGQPADFGKAFENDRWGEWIVFSIVFGLLVGIGALFCGIGALVVLAFFGLAPYFFIDKRMSLGDAFTASREAINQKNLMLPIVLTVLFGVVGILACCVGIIVTEAIAYIGVGLLYRYATGSPVAA